MIRSFTIITTTPNELCAPIHNRMPVILAPTHWRAWLGEEPATAEELLASLRPYAAELMRASPVDVRVGNIRNTDAALIEPVAAAS
jgi:putative SOS response-associated peptidase YedK